MSMHVIRNQPTLLHSSHSGGQSGASDADQASALSLVSTDKRRCIVNADFEPWRDNGLCA